MQSSTEPTAWCSREQSSDGHRAAQGTACLAVDLVRELRKCNVVRDCCNNDAEPPADLDTAMSAWYPSSVNLVIITFLNILAVSLFDTSRM